MFPKSILIFWKIMCLYVAILVSCSSWSDLVVAECAAAAVCAVSAPATVSFPLLPLLLLCLYPHYLLLLESHTIQYTIHKHRTSIGGSIYYRQIKVMLVAGRILNIVCVVFFCRYFIDIRYIRTIITLKHIHNTRILFPWAWTRKWSIKAAECKS